MREYVRPAEGDDTSAAQADEMRGGLELKRQAMEAWCRTAYGQVRPLLQLLASARGIAASFASILG